MSKPISIIVPTYNEADSITPLVEKLHAALAGYNYEIIFVDDDSQDGTGTIASGLSARYPVKLMVRKGKKGLASAVVDGLQQVSNDIVGVMDADLQHPPEAVPALVREIENGADVAIGSRYVKGGEFPDWGPVRSVISKGAIFLSHLFLPSTRKISDPVSGFFFFNRQVVSGAELKPTGYKILLELLIEGSYQKVAEVPYSFQLRHLGQSKLGARQQIDYLKHLFSLMRRKGELLRFFKFCLVGGSGVLVNMGLLWLLTEFAGLFYLLSAAISIEISIISNFTLNDYLTFPDRRSRGAGRFLQRLAKFNLVSLAGLGLNMGVLWLLTNVFGVYYMLSNLCGIAVATIWNYVANFWWTWK
ncbi:glycosyltransferase [Chloroflexota bacterium]